MTRILTPYDTGARLEPQLWPKGDADTFGLVDFDDDESHTVLTVLTVHVERRGSGYALHVRNLTATLTMVGEAGEALMVDATLLDGLPELLVLASRGRHDFERQVLCGETTPEERAAAGARWEAAVRTADLLRELTTDHP
ncbi:hypothetical protein [Clavibacter michiganensis]|uniref:hypothetical protein n=1 Tax=Clavibacter michiganensis TaxID=28447 RepID=UPI00292FE28C|nr:hypothetical protein [Clavibacter michiganensis]